MTAYVQVALHQQLLRVLPILGPSFDPPSTFCHPRRDEFQRAYPSLADYHLRRVNIIHRFYHSAFYETTTCPECNGTALKHKSWNQSYRRIHGVNVEEYVIGNVMTCSDCAKQRKAARPVSVPGVKDKKAARRKTKAGPRGDEEVEEAEGWLCSTGPAFWSRFGHWEVPRTL